MRALKLLVVGLVLLACQPAHSAEKIKMSISVFAGAFAMYFVAIDRGYFAEEGLEVEIIGAAGPTATAALMSGDLQFNGSAGAAVPAILRGAPLKVLMVSNDAPPYQLWSGNDKIKSLDDIKGKRVGVISTGDTHEFALRLLFMSKGVDPSGVIYVPIGPGAGRMAGISSGSLDAASLTLDEIQNVKNDPKMHMVADTSKLVKMINGGMATSDKMVGPERATAVKFVRAIIKGRRFAFTFENEAVDAVQKRNKTMSREALLDGLRLSKLGATADGTVPVDTQKLEISLRAEQLNLPKDKVPGPEKVFDFSVLNEVNKELDQKGWKPSL
jgi:NitT/TauT family transport system substrate-binding protein